MNDRTYYRLLYRMDGLDRWLIWFGNDDDHVDGVIVEDGSSAPSFLSSDSLMDYADAHGIPITIEEPILHDLDVVEGWLQEPATTTIDCDTHLSAINLFMDLARSIGVDYDAELDTQIEDLNLYSRLFYGTNLLTPPGEEPWSPTWDDEDVAGLVALLDSGLSTFRRSVRLAG